MGYNHFRYARRVAPKVLDIHTPDMSGSFRLDMSGGSNAILSGMTARGLQIRANLTTVGLIQISSTGTIFITPSVNKDIDLSPSGTGRLKFGTHTGTGDVAVNGYIPIKDSGGAARKLATVA